MLNISIIIPVRNESKHIASVLDQILAQDYDSKHFEILVVDGLSDDNTKEIVRTYMQRYLNIRLYDNPKRLSSGSRNIGVQQAQGDVVLIVDGHCLVDNSAMLKNIDAAFQSSGADCLGRPQPLEMHNATALQWSIASARRSPLGHHPDSFIYSGQAQYSPAMSVAIAYRKQVFDKVGLFDEHFDACEDVELNHRIDKEGMRCYFDPAIAVRYVPRGTFFGLARQMGRYGRGRVRLFRKHPDTLSLKSFGLGFFVLGVLVGLPICFVHWIFLWFYLGVILLYLVAICGETFRLAATQHRWSMLPYLPCVFFAIHFGFGWGILREFLCGKFLQ